MGDLDRAISCRFYDNAAAFGVDPAQITLVGQGVGAVMSEALSLAPAVQNMYSKLMLMSGSVFSLSSSASESAVC